MARSRASLVAAIFLLAGCAVGPAYQAPDIALPAGYGTPDATGPGAPATRWWSAFGDATLDGLVARALSGNLDLQQAAARARQARAGEAATRAAAGPAVNAAAQAGYTRLSENALPSALANLGSGSSGGSSGSGLGLPSEGFPTYQLGFDASWELDLFGGRRRANEAAGARTQGAMWSERDAQVLLTAEVANTYLQYRALQRRLAVADATLASQRELLDFIAVRGANGLSSSLDARRQQQAIEQLAAQRGDLAAQAEVRLHALALLLGAAPTTLPAELAQGPGAAPTVVAVPAGLPSDLLRRRPDIRAAERRLAAATADVGAATADLYPKLSLTGAAQLASRSLSSLLEADSLQANGAGRLSLPLLAGGRRATVSLREAQADEAGLAYRAAVLGALREVEDGLSRLAADRQRVERLQAAALAAGDAADTTAVRYRNGLIPYLEVLQARQTALSADDGLAQAQAAAAQDVVALYKALGGGWDERRNPIEEEPSGAADR